jgi:hypothetical protein
MVIKSRSQFSHLYGTSTILAYVRQKTVGDMLSKIIFYINQSHFETER